MWWVLKIQEEVAKVLFSFVFIVGEGVSCDPLEPPPNDGPGLLAQHIVKVCIAMMLPLICLTRTGRAQQDRVRVGVLQWITMNYSFVIQTVILVVTQAVPAESARGQ